ncbi:unnamed protein product [Phytomonas sp. Hart1]|nr:unnamed protein product [Phytomonas sp. Hart1]|eukprot:CCW72236.1 unnamed protein product [Phytomonas sp. isolate Hart1]
MQHIQLIFFRLDLLCNFYTLIIDIFYYIRKNIRSAIFKFLYSIIHFPFFTLKLWSSIGLDDFNHYKPWSYIFINYRAIH